MRPPSASARLAAAGDDFFSGLALLTGVETVGGDEQVPGRPGFQRRLRQGCRCGLPANRAALCSAVMTLRRADTSLSGHRSTFFNRALIGSQCLANHTDRSTSAASSTPSSGET